MQKPKVVVVVGPTASGKTSLGIELAKRFNGEIISADSRQVYRGLDLGSGKVTPSEMKGVPHHMLDVADPRTVYTVSDFVHEGRVALENILKRGNVPIIVGGSFFYVDALLGRVSFPEVPPDEELRTELDSMSTEALYAVLIKKDPRRAETIDRENRRRLIRAIEVSSKLGSVPLPYTESPYDVLIFGISIDKETLHKNIHTRLLSRIEDGMVEEVKELHDHGLSYDRLESLGLEYRYIARHLNEVLTYCEMITLLETKIRQFAKRQMTWLKRDKTITWIQPEHFAEIVQAVHVFLKK